MEKKGKAYLLKLEKFDLHPWLKRALAEGTNVTAIYDGLPLEELLMLDDLSNNELPGLRWVLRRQRGRYLLTILHPKHLEMTRDELKGEP